MASVGKKILIVIENLPAPFDRRVWQEALALKGAGYRVSIICPIGKGYEKRFEVIDDIWIYRHSLPLEAKDALGYIYEYSCALYWEFILSVKVLFQRGFDVIQACNPPDLIFLIGGFYKLFGKKFVFDHHDINPELWLAKGGKKGFIYKMLLWTEYRTFKTADMCIATNRSYKEIAIARGKKTPEEVFIVRSAPVIERLERLIPQKSDVALKDNRKYLVGYMGVMAKQDGVDYFLRAINVIVNERKRTDISFVCIGKGSEWEELQQYAKKLGITEYVKFTGRIPDKEMVEMLSACDVCVNPDEVNDFNTKSTMNKIIEYMVLGRPIVQFEMKEGRYSAQDASLYAKPNDPEDFAEKILELLGDDAKRKQMSDFGKKRVKEMLSWEKSEKELLKAYSYLWGKQ